MKNMSTTCFVRTALCPLVVQKKVDLAPWSHQVAAAVYCCFAHEPLTQFYKALSVTFAKYLLLQYQVALACALYPLYS